MAASKYVVDAIQYDNLESVTYSAIQHLGDLTSMGSEFFDSKLRKLWLCFIGILGSGLVGYASFPQLINILGLTLKGPFTKKLFKIFERYGWVKKSIFQEILEDLGMVGSFQSYFSHYVGMPNIGVAIAILEYYLDCWTAIKCEVITCSDPYGLASEDYNSEVANIQKMIDHLKRIQKAYLAD